MCKGSITTLAIYVTDKYHLPPQNCILLGEKVLKQLYV